MVGISLASAECALRSFGGGFHSGSQNGIARKPTEREDGHVLRWNNIHGPPWTPHLDQPGILPSGRRYIHDARVERQDGGSRSAVLESCERCLDESPRWKAPVQVRRTLPERKHILPSD